ncbi:MAG: hypothetical protein AAFP03_13825 [Cyanobacteria bacterium J06598_3]
MDARLIRQLWSAVESTPTNKLSNLDDSSLLSSLMDLLKSDPTFDPRNLSAMSQYISTRMPLIRELSQQA